MSFPRYPKYKPSGVEWLGDVPEGWEVKPLRSVFTFSKGLTITKEDLQDEGVPCVNYGEVHSKYGFRLNPIVHSLKCVAAEYQITNSDALIRDGDFVFADTSEDLEGSGNFTHLRSEEPIFAGYHTIIGRPRKDISPLLLAFQIHSSVFRSQIQKQVKGVKVFSISQGILKAAKCVLPPLAEQTAIAEFLDRETGKIDELVAEQRRLVELLKEKRQAVISHAVTQGLNPHAPMKPSGIEWLGDVPAHWEVWKLSHAFEMIGSGTTPKTDNREYYDDGTHPWVVTGDLNDGDLAECEKRITDRAFSDHTALRVYPPGAVVIAMYGATIGKLAILKFRAAVNQACCVFSGELQIYYKFLFYWFLGFRSQIISLASGGGQPNVNQDILRSLRVACPDFTEQSAIVAFLDAELAKFDTLTAEAQRAIDLLQERRTALISAAVTGQIDVRNHSPEP